MSTRDSQIVVPFCSSLTFRFQPNRFPFFYPSIEPKWVIRESGDAAPSKDEQLAQRVNELASPIRDWFGWNRASGCRLSGRNRDHLVVQPSQPAVRHGGGNQAARLAAFLHPFAEVVPVIVPVS